MARVLLETRAIIPLSDRSPMTSALGFAARLFDVTVVALIFALLG